MAHNDTSHQVSAIRSATFRLTSTPADQLLRVVPQICVQLASSRDVLSSPTKVGAAGEGDTSALVHKLKTRISSLLQDRSVEARWSGAVTAKTAIECGGHTILQDVLPWVRGLLASLSKPDPPTAKKIYIIVLTRIFFLTREHQVLVREITTPNLPALLAACLKLLHSTPQLAQTIFECLSQLAERHPTIFRTSTSQLRAVLINFVAPIQNDAHMSIAAQEAARRLLVQLHECAPKAASSVEWEAGFKHAVTSAHEHLDQIFRSVLEDWESDAGYHPVQHSVQKLSMNPARLEKDHIGLSPCSGCQDGARRVCGILMLLRSYVSTATSYTTSLPAGAVLDLLARVFSLTRPSSHRDWETSGRADVSFERKEREELALTLPSIHVAAVPVADALLQRLSRASASVASVLLKQLTEVFVAERAEARLREATYPVFARLLSLYGAGLVKLSVESLSPVAVACCDDLLPSPTARHSVDHVTSTNSNGVTADLKKARANRTNLAKLESVGHAAYNLLPLLLGSLQAELIPSPMRAEMDRAAVLVQHKAALIASIQNPSPHHQSILPLAARIFPLDFAIRGLIKPSMPILKHSSTPIISDAVHEDAASTHVSPNRDPEMQFDADQSAEPWQRDSRLTLFHLFPVEAPTETSATTAAEETRVREGMTDPSEEVKMAGPETSQPHKRPLLTPEALKSEKRQRVEPVAGPQPSANPIPQQQPYETDWNVQDPVTILPRGTNAGASDMHARGHDSHDTYVAQNAAEAVASSNGQRAEKADSSDDDDDDDEDFEVPELHLRGDSDNDDEV